ncbi:MAG: putative GNAT superfamily acetyltransferase [Flavobacteriaceae bacterium]|jgi:predicted GNAT superfamily acetyltransferase
MIQYKTASSSEELHQILALQKSNLPISISSEEKDQEGFLTVDHEFDILKRMNDVCPHIIAVDNNVLAGYTLCMHTKFAEEIEILKPLFTEIGKHSTPFKTYVIMGQVCVAKEYRKRGVFRKLYAKMKASIFPEFDAIVTEVDASNRRSLEAHYAIGFKILSKHRANHRDWVLIYLM